MKIIGIIPARYASARFPGKPLAMLCGKPVVQWVYEHAREALADVWVAADDIRILQAVEDFGGLGLMTSANHDSGTQRVGEAFRKIKSDADIIVNIQGDEPMLRSTQILQLANGLAASQADIATLVCPFPKGASYKDISDPNVVKVVADENGYAMYFSRFPIPYQRNVDPELWAENVTYFAHIGVYAFRRSALEKVADMPPTILQRAESLEQLGWLHRGLKIKTIITDSQTIGIDTPEDLEKARLIF